MKTALPKFTFYRACFIIVLLTQFSNSLLYAEVLYSREITEALKSEYNLYAINTYFENDKTEKQIRDEYLLKNWGAGTAIMEGTTLSVELLHDEKKKNRPYIRIAYLGENLVKKQKSDDWAKNAIARFGIGHDVAEYKYMGVGAANLGHVSVSFIRDDLGQVGTLMENYTAATVSVTDSCGPPIDMHQFIRNIINCNSMDIKITRKGRVVIAKMPRGEQRVAWLCGESVAFLVVANAGNPMAIAELYLEKYPSSLPEKIQVDKLEWGRQETQFWLDKLAANIRGEIGMDDPNWAPYFFSELFTRLYYPNKTKYDNVLPNDRKLLYDRVAKWWSENKDQSYWDKKQQQIMIKGQSPEDIENAVRKEAEDKLQRLIDAPMTPKEEEEARLALAAEHDKDRQREAQSARKNFNNDPRAKVEKTGDQWIRTIPSWQGHLIVSTISGPFITKNNDKRLPLQGEFRIKTVEHYPAGAKEWENKHTYFYDKIDKKWFPSYEFHR